MPEASANSAKMHDAPFDVDAQQLAQIYAQAGLDAAGSHPEQAALVEELKSLVADVLDKDRRLEELFASGLISEDDKLAIVDRIFGGRASTTTLVLMKVMAEHGRLGYLRHVVHAAAGIWQERSGHVHVDVETALPLDADSEKELVRSLKARLGKEPDVVARVNPDLLAGIVIRVGDKVFDASARSNLERTRQAMLDRAVETIQSEPKLFMAS